MSKVISFSISDKYLDKLRSLYPHLTDNLAVKQFVTDGLDSSLGSSLDGNLDGDLDGKLKSLIETSLDGILEGRLDATVGKSLTSLSERMARLEARLDTNLDGSLDDKLDYGLPYQPSKNELTETQRRVLESRQLAKAKLEHAAYLVKNPLVVRDLTKKQPIAVSIETVETADTVEIADKVETAIETVETVTDTVEAVDKVETMEPDSIDEPGTDAIETVPDDSPQMKTQLSEAVDIENRQGLTNAQLSEKKGIPIRTIQNWANKIQKGKEITSSKYPKFFKQWRLNPNDSLWYEIN